MIELDAYNQKHAMNDHMWKANIQILELVSWWMVLYTCITYKKKRRLYTCLLDVFPYTFFLFSWLTFVWIKMSGIWNLIISELSLRYCFIFLFAVQWSIVPLKFDLDFEEIMKKKKNILTRCKTYCKRKMLLNAIKFLIIQLLIIISWMQSYCCRWSVPDWNLLCA